MKVVGYCRYSSEAQRDGFSIEAQKEAITTYCDINNHTLLRFFVDEAQSATVDDRDNFLEMISQTKNGEFEGIVVHKLDRFARNRYDSSIYGKILEDRNIKLFSVCEPIIADDSPESLLFRGVIETMNEYYSKNLAREVLKGQRVAARDGRYLGGYIPFGYSLDKDNHFIVNNDEAPIVLEIFKRLDAGDSIADVVRWVHTQNVLTRTGKEFTSVSILSLARNPIYIGKYVWGRESKRIKEPIIVENACEAIIPRDLFERVNSTLAERRNAIAGRLKEADYLLTGLLYCEYCGCHLYGFKSITDYTSRKTGEHHRYASYKYRCAHDSHSSNTRRLDSNYVKPTCELKMLPKDALEQLVADAVRQDLFSPDAVEFIAKAMQERMSTITPGSPEAIKKVDTQIRANSQKQHRLLDLYLDGAIDKSSYTAKKRELDEMMNFLSTERSKLQAPPPVTSIETIKNAIAKYSDSASCYSPETTRLLVSTFVDHIDVSNDHIVIYYALDFPALPESSTISFVRNGSNGLPQLFLRTEFLISHPKRSKNPEILYGIERVGSSIITLGELQNRPT